jgi:hypothetical protein
MGVLRRERETSKMGMSAANHIFLCTMELTMDCFCAYDSALHLR